MSAPDSMLQSLPSLGQASTASSTQALGFTTSCSSWPCHALQGRGSRDHQSPCQKPLRPVPEPLQGCRGSLTCASVPFRAHAAFGAAPAAVLPASSAPLEGGAGAAGGAFGPGCTWGFAACWPLGGIEGFAGPMRDPLGGGGGALGGCEGAPPCRQGGVAEQPQPLGLA